MTNGVTPRRWLAQASPPLSRLIDHHIGDGWRLDLDQLRRCAAGDDAGFLTEFRAKSPTATPGRVHRRATGIAVSADSLFDVQVKRIHEYKRQLLNLLHVVARSRHPGRARCDWVRAVSSPARRRPATTWPS